MAKGFQKPTRDMRKPTSGKTKPPASQASPFAIRAGLAAGGKASIGKPAAKPAEKKDK